MHNRRSFTMVEVLISSVIVLMLFSCSIGVFMMIKQIFRDKIAEHNLHQSANMLTSKIIRGYAEGGSIVGLRSASSFTIPAVVPVGSRVDYVGADGNTRSYFLNGNTVRYSSPTQWPNQTTVYTAPAGAAITLRFWEPPGAGDHETIGIYFAVSQVVGTKRVSGSASTCINIRNMTK